MTYIRVQAAGGRFNHLMQKNRDDGAATFSEQIQAVCGFCPRYSWLRGTTMLPDCSRCTIRRVRPGEIVPASVHPALVRVGITA